MGELTGHPPFQREHAVVLAARLVDPRRFLHVVAGPRQVGKTTLVQQVLKQLDRPSVVVSADEPTLRDGAWLAAQWERARLLAKDSGGQGAVLAVDEVQKIPDWSKAVKRLWDVDTRHRLPLRVVLVGSAPMLAVPLAHSGLAAFTAALKPKRTLLVGGDGIPVHEFRSRPVTDWLQP